MVRLAWTQATGIALAMIAAGCAGRTPEPAPPPGVTSTQAQPSAEDVAPAGTASSDYQDESTAELEDHDRHHHHAGLAMFIAMSLDSLGTTPEQDVEIHQIQSNLFASMQPARDAEKSVTLALADGVATGHVDQPRVEAAIAQLSSAAADVHQTLADSLDQLHAVLTAPQREALVDKLDAHRKVWREANSDEETPATAKRHGRLEALTRDLALTPDQVDKIRASLRVMTAPQESADWKDSDARFQKFRDEFASDHFDAHALASDRAAGALTGRTAVWGATRMSHFYEAMTPVLSTDQRAKLADILRRHANAQATPTLSAR